MSAHLRTYRSLTLAILTFGALLAVFTVMVRADVNSSGSAQEQTTEPTIILVEPEPSHCVLRNAVDVNDRLLTISGDDLLAFGDRRLQFLDLATGRQSILFDDEVSWQDPRRIWMDMALANMYFQSDVRLRLKARITSAESPELASEWSDEFTLARDQRSCGYRKPFPRTSSIRGIAGDYWADVVIGKSDFSEIGENRVVPFKVFNPGGVVVDRSVDPGRAYIWDGGNSRVLGIDLEECYETVGPCTADIVIGQPSGYDHSACNGDSGVQNFPVRPIASAETLCGIPDTALSPGESHSFVTMATDRNGDLYVPDFFNHRILKYENPFESDSVADRVWGQEDFAGAACNRGVLDKPTAKTLCFRSASNQSYTNRFGTGVEIDVRGDMWVADGGNNRVLRFPLNPNSRDIAATPDLVLGQLDFHSSETGDALDRLHGPSAVRMSENGWLYVADTINDRVLIFKSPLQSGMRAEEFGSGFRRPTSLEIDPLGRGVWVVDAGNSMIELWDPTGNTLLQVLGKDSYRPDGHCGHPYFELPEEPRMCPVAGSVGIDKSGNVLVPVYLGTAEVLRFPMVPAEVGRVSAGSPDRRIFYPPAKPNFTDRSRLLSARGVAVWQDQLIVADKWRLMFWDGLDALYNGRPADGVVGDEFTVSEWHYCCGRIKVDDAGRLWVLSFEGRYYLDVYQLPLTEYSVPLHTIWKDTASFPVLGTDKKITLGGRLFGIAPEGNGEFLWLSDTDNHRVIRIRDPLTDPVVDVILGQQNATGTGCNQGRFPSSDRTTVENVRHTDVLCFPGALSIDRLGNLYVSDHSLEVHGNWRLLVFSSFSTISTSSEAIYAPHARKQFVRSASTPSYLSEGSARDRETIGQSWHVFYAATWEPAFDSTNRMVVGYNAYAGPRFVGVYDDPLSQGGLPTSYLYDFGSMNYTATFDDQDNLYVGDINRGRVLVYRNPFGNKSEPSDRQAEKAPAPSHPVNILAVSPKPPYCVVRNSVRPYEYDFNLSVDELSIQEWVTLEFRKITSLDREFFDIGPSSISDNGTRITVSGGPSLWRRMWGHLDQVVLTVRILDRSTGAPISNWSPAFMLAENVETCGIALPTPTPMPTPTPSPTPTPTPSPTPSPTPTHTPTPVPTLTPIPSPTPTYTPTPPPPPKPMPALTPTPSPPPSPKPVPTQIPTPSPAPTHTPTAVPSQTPSPSPTPTIVPTPSPSPMAVQAPKPSPTPTIIPTRPPTPTPAPTLTPTPPPTRTALPEVPIRRPTASPTATDQPATDGDGPSRIPLIVTIIVLAILIPTAVFVWIRRR